MVTNFRSLENLDTDQDYFVSLKSLVFFIDQGDISKHDGTLPMLEKLGMDSFLLTFHFMDGTPFTLKTTFQEDGQTQTRVSHR